MKEAVPKSSNIGISGKYSFAVTEEVPQVDATNKIGCDRGQNNLAVVAPKNGFGKFFSGKEVMHRRRYFQKRRKQLQSAKKFRALKKWDRKERRWMDAALPHCFASDSALC
nr:transposase [Brasilonema octagenarum]